MLRLLALTIGYSLQRITALTETNVCSGSDSIRRMQRWHMGAPPSPESLPQVRQDIDFDGMIFRDLPEGWQSPSGFTEAFLIAAALEYQERIKIDPYSPWTVDVSRRVPTWCRYDPLMDLCSYGGRTQLETAQQTTVLNQHEMIAGFARGEQYARFPLLQLLWEYLDEVLPRLAGNERSFYGVIQKLDGLEFGKLGTTLFLAALPQALERSTSLSEAEQAFAAGLPFRAQAGSGAMVNWNPSAETYVESIWFVCFRLIEANSPEYYLNKFAHRVPEITSIIREGGRLGDHALLTSPMRQNNWPGWDFVLANR